MVSILIVDDHLLVRIGLKQVLAEEYRDLVFGEAQTAEEALAAVAKQPWDLVILDITLPDRDGFHVLREALQRRSTTRVLVLSVHQGDFYAARARQLGAFGFIDKSAGRGEIVRALRNVLAGRLHFSQSVLGQAGGPEAMDHLNLSAREYKVFLALVAGKRTSEIAAELKLSEKTVTTYKRRVMHKMNLKSLADLVRYAIKNGLS